MLGGCVIVATRAFDALSAEDQQAIRAAGGKAGACLDEVGRASDEALLGGLFAKRAVTMIKTDEGLRDEFFASIAAARDRLPDRIVPHPLILQSRLAGRLPRSGVAGVE